MIATPRTTVRAALTAALVTIATAVAHAQYSAVWYDGYAVSANSGDVNFEYNNPARQGGVLRYINYAQSPAAGDYHHQLKGQTGDTLQLAGDSAGIGEASPNYNFINSVSGDVVGKVFFQMRMGTFNNTVSNYTWTAFTLGANTPLVGVYSNAPNFGVLFVHDTLFGNGDYMQFRDGGALVLNLIPFPAGVSPATNLIGVTFLISDPTDENPWNGVGSTVIRMYIGSTYIASYTKTGGGYTNNFMSMQGGPVNPTSTSTVLGINYFDELTVSTAPATLYKANNADNLNVTTSWSGGGVPGGADIAQWSSTVTAANSAALGANLSLGGIKVTTPGGAVTISSGNTLTLGNAGIDLLDASQNLTISSGLTLGAGQQTWTVNTGKTLTQNTGTFTRNAGATLLVDKTVVSGIVTASPALVNSVLPWGFVRNAGTAAAGSANGYTVATVSSGNIVPYTGATAATTGTSTWGGIPSGGTGLINYDVSLTTPSNAGSLRDINTLRYVGGAATESASGPGLLLKANCILNAGTGTLTIGGTGGTPGMGISSSSSANELVLVAANAGLTFGSYSTITNNGANATAVTVTGPNTVTFLGTNTYTGNTTISAGILALSGNGSISNTPSIALFSGATLDVSGLNTPLTLGAGQTLQAGAAVAYTTANIAVAAGKNLTLGGTTTGLAFTAFGGGATAPLTVTGVSAGSLDLSSKPVTVTTIKALPAGAYKLIGKAGLATVTGTPGALTVNGSGVTAGGTASLRVTAGELYLDVVTSIATTTTVTRSAGTSPATYGTTLTFKASVVPGSGSSVPTGTVQFYTNGVAYGSPVTVVTDIAPNGKAELTTASLPYSASAYTVTATYTASGSFTGGSDNTGISQTINKATPTATLAVNNSPVTYSGAAQAATVGIASSSVPGTVQNISTGGAASQTVSGTYAVTADFVPNDTANYNTLTGLSAGNFVIQPKAASVTADAKTKTYGDANPPLTATETGAINGDVLNYTLATDATQFSSVGVSNITVTLGNNPNYSVSATNSTLTINPAATFVGATSTLNPSGYKDTVSYIATLPTNATGSVVFSSTNGPISTNTLSSGSATSLAITNLPRGTNLITIAYLGDGNYLGSSTNLEQIVTNHPPMLTPLTLTRTAGLGLHFPWSQLTNQWSDADGDAVTLTTFILSTTNSVTLSTNDTLVGYPSSAPNVADQINYTASDSYGDTIAGVINITVNAYVTGTNSIVNITAGNPTTLTAYGVIGYSYITERSTNLTDWVSVATNTVSTNGVISVSDSFSDLGGQQPNPAFYRIKWQP